MAGEALARVRQIQEDTRSRCGLEPLVTQIARALHVETHKLLGRSRKQPVSTKRQIAMYVVRKLTGASTTTVGAIFDRDHSTVVAACQIIERRAGSEPKFRSFVEGLRQATVAAA
jgi:chromosomal replication initiator protein